MKVLERSVPPALLLFLLCPWLSRAAAPVPSVSIGQNLTSSTYGAQVSAIPADANGAIGPRHFVELINGSFAVYNKTNGRSVKRVTDVHFWSSAGVVISPDDATTDPRIIYDPTVQRWFASMVDVNATGLVDPTLYANDFLLAVSATSDPTGVWHGFLFQADPDNGYFADFPTLGVDSNAVYLSGDFYYGETSPIGPGLWSFPKADLVASTPIIDHATWFGVMDYSARGQVLQPAICLDGTASGRILSVTDIGNDSNPHSGLVSFAVKNAGGPGASLSDSAIIPTASWVVPDNADLGAPLFTCTQPDFSSTLMANDARLCAKVYAVGGVLYAVHSTEFNGRVAIRWYRIQASNNVLLESGTIADPALDLFFPSIAANPYGVVTIAFNACGLSTTVSSYAMVGQTINGVTTFGSRVMLKSGVTSYHGDDELLAILLEEPPYLSRWGDYSATSVDPSDPNRFWTIQMFPDTPADPDYPDVWSTQITELVITPLPIVAIQRTGPNVMLSWPPLTGFQLQSATNLTTTMTWSNVTTTPVTNGVWLTVSLPASPAKQFFRLRKP